MDYNKIHDSIICRAKSREYNSSLYQNHHIIPICEDSESIETVPLTIKEHRIVHLLRYKMGYNLGNLKAYYFLKGNNNIETNLLICSLAGKMGGRKTKTMGLGIFSESWNRGLHSKRLHSEGLITTHFESNPDVASKYGKNNYLSKLGIHNPIYSHLRSDWARIGAKALIDSGQVGGYCSEEWRANNQELMLEYCSSGGKIGGKIVGSLPWWTDGEKNKRSEISPGYGWYRGMTKNKG